MFNTQAEATGVDCKTPSYLQTVLILPTIADETIEDEEERGEKEKIIFIRKLLLMNFTKVIPIYGVSHMVEITCT